MSKLTLAALISGLALSLASSAVLAADTAASRTKGDEPSVVPESKKGLKAKEDTRSEKAKAASTAVPMSGDNPASSPQSKKGITQKADTRSEKAKAEASAAPKSGDDPASSPQSKKK